MKSLFIRLFVFFLLVCAQAGANPGTLEIRPVTEGAPIVTLSDLTDARVIHSGQGALLSLTMTPAGARKLVKYSARHVGEKLEMAVNGRIVDAAVIRDAIRGPRFQVGPLDRTQADDVVRLVRSSQVR